MGLSREEARDRVCVLDSRGLLVEGRSVEAYKQPFVQPRDKIAGWQIANEIPTLLEAIEHTQATALLGLSGQAGAFNHPVVQAMARNTTRPVIFPLSNPTSGLRGATGRHPGLERRPGDRRYRQSFPGRGAGRPRPLHRPGQQRLYLPGSGFWRHPGRVSRGDRRHGAGSGLRPGRLHRRRAPAVGSSFTRRCSELREVSIRVGARVIEQALKEGVAGKTDLAGRDLDTYLRSRFWKPRYLAHRARRSHRNDRPSRLSQG
ncbi:MAG: hypothetical protein MZV65_30530 [Chromatiales bacterium]|nr:hypothetical protein [Chromatiales bacterium]